MKLISHRLLAIIAGVLMPLAFAPTNLFFLAIISPALLLFLWQDTSAREAFWRGLLYGLGAFGVGVSWIYISIHDFGNSNFLIGFTTTALFVFILALFPALTGYLLQKLFPKNNYLKTLLAFPCLWVLLEWLRSWIFTGFPWLLLAHSQTFSPLRGFAPIVGVYGVSFLVVLSSALLFLLYKKEKLALSFSLLITIWLGGYLCSFIHWNKPIGHPIQVSLVQGNIPQSVKWSATDAINALHSYEKLSKQHWQSDLILWPETAVTILTPDALNQLQQLDAVADKAGKVIITGIPIPDAMTNVNDYFNGAVIMGDGEGHYYKRHLVPFGEYVPLENILGKLLAFLDIPMSDFIPGPLHQPLLQDQDPQNPLFIGTYICYEIAYSHLLRADLPQANILVNLSNDAWFGHSFALAQQQQIAQFAAESAARYMLIATNNGNTAVVDPQGNIVAAAPAFETYVLTATVQGMTGTTPWIWLGNTPIIILLVMVLVGLRLKK